ncbi:MAG: MotA/TolQ/ExbB proton channel family protein [Sulfurimicrobium sp.]|jgi:biopolymer transport protein ExbB|nr:MotA/TolQ/ExbB proton channel family protein [Sulfurimicrobium sp.]MDO9190774.1 MotA/TolQ/ExbB proton channel family protein [Sulfurimicrobium sp.]MDP1705347.1 MotA/TolQ/ExbB proton channel family protein [Sulfurimicrobium sp.]MDP2197996.1 MotA/TolQ/ExbB proton channel family protein [Sulfurimicrobium sp.]MDP2963872.1 MotA/TolQ/ExbB proton channel family protein [Sulfurimicrobium sp.]
MFGQATSPIVAATLWLLVSFSVISWTLIVMKAWMQFRLSRQNSAFTKTFWSARNLTEAESAAQQAQGPLAQLCRAGFEALRDIGKDGANSLQNSGDRQDVLERRLRAEVQKELHKLESGLMVLASIGSTAPFVGLFGTVWGIMHALQDISRTGSAGLDVVAGPIGEALIATAVGIATAIPAVLAYNYGLRQVRLYGAELEAFANDFLHLALKSGFSVK